MLVPQVRADISGTQNRDAVPRRPLLLSSSNALAYLCAMDYSGLRDSIKEPKWTQQQEQVRLATVQSTNLAATGITS